MFTPMTYDLEWCLYYDYLY